MCEVLVAVKLYPCYVSLLSSPVGGNSCAECPQSLATGAAQACRVQGTAESPAAGVGGAAGTGHGPEGECFAILSIASHLHPGMCGCSCVQPKQVESALISLEVKL